jgi:hypothetical protein
VRRFVIRAGEANLENLYRLSRADAYAMEAKESGSANLLPLAERVEKILAGSRALSLKDLAISGKDLMDIGIKQGKVMGLILGELFETVVDDPEINKREKLLEIAEHLKNKYGT